THVPYKGTGLMVTDLIGGHVDSGYISQGPATPHVKAGTMRALAVTSAKRTSVMPDVPTVAETIAPGFEATVWYAMLAPAGTPDAVREKLNANVQKALDSDSVKNLISKIGA